MGWGAVVRVWTLNEERHWEIHIGPCGEHVTLVGKGAKRRGGAFKNRMRTRHNAGLVCGDST